MPDLPARHDVYPKQIVGNASDDSNLSRALRAGDSLGDKRSEQVVHRPRRALELQLP